MTRSALLVLQNTRALWRMLALAAGLAVVVGVVTLLTPRRYSAGFAVVPQVADAGNTGLSSIASQLGVKLGSVDLTQTPLFYAELLGSSSFQRDLVSQDYRVVRDGVARDTALFLWLKPPGATREQQRQRAAILLRDRVSVGASSRTGVVRFSVSLKDSALVRQVAERALVALEQFNRETKSTQARAERVFLEARSDSLRLRLRESEDRLSAFDATNRSTDLSPELRTLRGRLDREVRMQEAVYQVVRQQLERSRMEEVRNTPLVTVVEGVAAPAWPDRRYLIIKTGFTFGAGLVGSFVLVVLLLEAGADLPMRRLREALLRGFGVAAAGRG